LTYTELARVPMTARGPVTADLPRMPSYLKICFSRSKANGSFSMS
jgi:hypothetical protein